MPDIRFVYDEPLERTMEFEAAYPAQLQMSLSAKRALRRTPGAIYAWMYLGGRLAGEAYGVPMKGFSGQMEGRELLIGSVDDAFYCFSNTVMAEFRGIGVGTLLKAHWLGLVAGAGYHTVYGHARPGASQALNASFGARFLSDFADW